MSNVEVISTSPFDIRCSIFDIPSMKIRILTASDIRATLPMRDAITAMRTAFGALASGTAIVPLRTAVAAHEEGAVSLFMPGRLADDALGAKIVSVFPNNAERGLARVHATVLLLRPATGEPAALLEGTSLTALRTGAASGLATDLLARANASTAAIVGSGVQARTQLEAVCCVRDIDRALVCSRSRDHAERFAQECTARNGFPDTIEVVDSVEDAVTDADVVCTATSSATPVLAHNDIRPGTHVNAIGSFTSEMREIDPKLLGRAITVVDQREASLAEAGEVITAIEMGFLTDDALLELGGVLNGTSPGRPDDEAVTVFKSVGLAAQDLAAGTMALRHAEAMGLGTVIEL